MTPSLTDLAPDPAAPAMSASQRRAVVGGVLVTTAAGALGTAFLPYLLVEHPVLLLVTASDLRNIVLVASQVDLLTVIGVAVPRRAVGMLATYGLGVLYGRTMLAWSARKLPRLARLLALFERFFLRFRRTLLLLWPVYTTCGIAGVTRMRLRAFVPWMVLGQLGYVIVCFYLGDLLSQWTSQLVAALSRHVWESTAVCVTLVSTQQLVALVRRRRAAQRLGELGAAEVVGPSIPGA